MSAPNVEVVRRFLDAVERDDVPGCLACLDPDLEWVPLRAATEGVYHGHGGFAKFVADTNETFEIFQPQFELQDLDGEQVLAWGTISVRGRGSGVDLEVAVGGIFNVSGGRIRRWHDFGSREAALDAAR